MRTRGIGDDTLLCALWQTASRKDQPSRFAVPEDPGKRARPDHAESEGGSAGKVDERSAFPV